MRYMGSKNRIAKYILPIMLKTAKNKGINKWVEPFVGGGNMIDKVPAHFKREGYDINGHVIQALIDIRDRPADLLEYFTPEQRKEHKIKQPQTLISHACLVTSFGGDLRGGYAREKNSDYSTFCIYGKKNAYKQSPNIQNVKFETKNYLELNLQNCLIYCDPPYKNTAGYSTEFDHALFYEWCMAQAENNIVYVSEYEMPLDFIPVWEKDVKTNIASQRKSGFDAKEKLFTLL